MEALAGGKLRLDEPAPHVTRLTIDNPAKRNALDHDILDALADVLPRLEARCLLITGAGKVFSAGYDIGALPHGRLRAGGRGDRRPPVHRRDRGARRLPVPGARRAQRPRDRRRAGAGALVRPARLQRRRAARHAAGAARPDLLAHRPAQVPRRDRRAAHARAVLHRAQRRRARRRCSWGLVGEVLPAGEVAARGVELAAEIAANAPLSLVGNKRVIRALLAARGRARPRRSRRSSSRCATPASARRTSSRACARSRRSARRAGRGVRDSRATLEGVRRLAARLLAAALLARARGRGRDADRPRRAVTAPVVDPPIDVAPLARARQAVRRPARRRRPAPGRGRSTSGPTTGACARRRTGRGGAGAPTGSSRTRARRARARTAPRTRTRRASASPTCRARTAAASARNFGGLGHASHQNGLDVDILYPRARRARAARVGAAAGRRGARAGPRRPLRRRRRDATCSPAGGWTCAARAGSS